MSVPGATTRVLHVRSVGEQSGRYGIAYDRPQHICVGEAARGAVARPQLCAFAHEHDQPPRATMQPHLQEQPSSPHPQQPLTRQQVSQRGPRQAVSRLEPVARPAVGLQHSFVPPAPCASHSAPRTPCAAPAPQTPGTSGSSASPPAATPCASASSASPPAATTPAATPSAPAPMSPVALAPPAFAMPVSRTSMSPPPRLPAPTSGSAVVYGGSTPSGSAAVSETATPGTGPSEGTPSPAPQSGEEDGADVASARLARADAQDGGDEASSESVGSIVVELLPPPAAVADTTPMGLAAPPRLAAAPEAFRLASPCSDREDEASACSDREDDVPMAVRASPSVPRDSARMASELLRLRAAKVQHDRQRVQLDHAQSKLRRLSVVDVLQLHAYLERHLGENLRGMRLQDAIICLIEGLCYATGISVPSTAHDVLLRCVRSLLRDPEEFPSRLCGLQLMPGRKAENLAPYLVSTSEYRAVTEPEVNRCFDACHSWLIAFYFLSLSWEEMAAVDAKLAAQTHECIAGGGAWRRPPRSPGAPEPSRASRAGASSSPVRRSGSSCSATASPALSRSTSPGSPEPSEAKAMPPRCAQVSPASRALRLGERGAPRPKPPPPPARAQSDRVLSRLLRAPKNEEAAPRRAAEAPQRCWLPHSRPAAPASRLSPPLPERRTSLPSTLLEVLHSRSMRSTKEDERDSAPRRVAGLIPRRGAAAR